MLKHSFVFLVLAVLLSGCTQHSTQTIKDSQLYRLIEGAEYAEHTLEIIAEKPGLRAFTFTFG